MKAEELMIDDWVISRKRGKDEILQVVTVDGDSNTAWLDGDSYSGLVKGDDIFPIPLTTEILEKNGFVKDEFSLFMYPLVDGVVRFDEHQYGLYCNIIQPLSRYDSVCNYVHQLQHALRLCGIEKEHVLRLCRIEKEIEL